MSLLFQIEWVYFFDPATNIEGWSLVFESISACCRHIEVVPSLRIADFLQTFPQLDGFHSLLSLLPSACLPRVFPPYGVSLELSSRFVIVVALMLLELSTHSQVLHSISRKRLPRSRVCIPPVISMSKSLARCWNSGTVANSYRICTAWCSASECAWLADNTLKTVKTLLCVRSSDSCGVDRLCCSCMSRSATRLQLRARQCAWREEGNSHITSVRMTW